MLIFTFYEFFEDVPLWKTPFGALSSCEVVEIVFFYDYEGHFIFWLRHQKFSKRIFSNSLIYQVFRLDVHTDQFLGQFFVFKSVLVKTVHFFPRKTAKIGPWSISVKATFFRYQLNEKWLFLLFTSSLRMLLHKKHHLEHFPSVK